MKTITALTAQKQNRERINVYLNEEFAFGLAAIVASRLKVGQELSGEEMNQLQQQDSLEKARESALRLIERRPRSSTEIVRALRDKGFDEEIVAQLVQRFNDVGLLDDTAFAQYWVEQRATFKPRSRRVLEQELRQKGAERSVIEEALSGMDETETARQAAQQYAHRLAQLPEEAFKNKLGGFLQRRGFGYEVVKQIIIEVWEEVSAEQTADE